MGFEDGMFFSENRGVLQPSGAVVADELNFNVFGTPMLSRTPPAAPCCFVTDGKDIRDLPPYRRHFSGGAGAEGCIKRNVLRRR